MSLQYGQEFRILCKSPIQHFKYSDSFVNPTFWEFRNFANEDKIQDFFKKGISKITAVWQGIQDSLQIANPTF